MTRLRLIVGLGNPGAEHLRTRHNAGFWFVDALAQRERARFGIESKLHAETAKLIVRGRLAAAAQADHVHEQERHRDRLGAALLQDRARGDARRARRSRSCHQARRGSSSMADMAVRTGCATSLPISATAGFIACASASAIPATRIALPPGCSGRPGANDEQSILGAIGACTRCAAAGRARTDSTKR